MRFCSHCGEGVERRIPAGDHRERFVCASCGMIHYQNPKIVAGCIIDVEGRILLCRRGIEPRYGKWTVPAGFMENGESTQNAAARETWEEARALVDDLRLFTLFNLPHINQVYSLFRARLAQPGFDVSDESLETRLFSADELPWDEMAFPVVAESLKLYLADRAGGGFRLHSGNLIRLPGEAVRFRVEMHE